MTGGEFRTGARHRGQELAAWTTCARGCPPPAASGAGYREAPSGGHFAYLTDPDLVTTDLRAFFAGLG